MSTKTFRRYKISKNLSKNKDTYPSMLYLFNTSEKEATGIPVVKIEHSLFGPEKYVCKLPFDVNLQGVGQGKAGDLVYCENGLRIKWKIIKPTNTDYNKLLKSLSYGDADIPRANRSKTSQQKEENKDLNLSTTSSTSDTNSSTNTSSTTSTDSTTDTDSTTSTDTSTDSTTTRSFDFLDNVLGTQKEGSKDKATELDPNQVANTIVSDTKLNDTAISSLVATYLNSLHRINRSYNTQTK